MAWFLCVKWNSCWKDTALCEIEYLLQRHWLLSTMPAIVVCICYWTPYRTESPEDTLFGTVVFRDLKCGVGPWRWHTLAPDLHLPWTLQWLIWSEIMQKRLLDKHGLLFWQWNSGLHIPRAVQRLCIKSKYRKGHWNKASALMSIESVNKSYYTLGYTYLWHRCDWYHVK